MKRRHQRFLIITAALTLSALAVYFVLSAFQKNLVFFFTPTQVIAGEAPINRSFRIGGMVQKNSVKRQADGVTVQFIVTDMHQSVPLQFKGSLPDLFKEGKGVVAEGKLNNNLEFIADLVLAKHDENYMPPEAKYALEKHNNEQ